MGETTSVSEEKLIVSRFRELSEEGKQQLVDYMEFLYQLVKWSTSQIVS